MSLAKKLQKNNKKKSTILIGVDHNSLDLKNHLKIFLTKKNYNIVDIGCYRWEPTDYVAKAEIVAQAIQFNPNLIGILSCKTGIGISQAANRFDGVRAALIRDVETAKLTRQHNNSNVLVLSSLQSTPEQCEEIVCAFLNEPWEEGRHVSRVRQMDKNVFKNVNVLVPGIFDVLTVEMVKLFKYAKSIGTTVVAVSSDQAAQKITGVKPKNTELDRRKVLESIIGVDEVFINYDEHVDKILKNIKIDYIVKGNNFTEEQVRKTDGVPNDTKIILFDPKSNFGGN